MLVLPTVVHPTVGPCPNRHSRSGTRLQELASLSRAVAPGLRSSTDAPETEGDYDVVGCRYTAEYEVCMP